MTQSTCYKSAAIFVSVFACLPLAAQTPNTAITAPIPPGPPAPGAGLFNDWLREQNSLFETFDLGAQFRGRYVYQTYFAVPGGGSTAVDFRANTPYPENDFLLLRTRVHAGYSPT